jgi:hypothetical protein
MRLTRNGHLAIANSKARKLLICQIHMNFHQIMKPSHPNLTSRKAQKNPFEMEIAEQIAQQSLRLTD